MWVVFAVLTLLSIILCIYSAVRLDKYGYNVWLWWLICIFAFGMLTIGFKNGWTEEKRPPECPVIDENN